MGSEMEFRPFATPKAVAEGPRPRGCTISQDDGDTPGVEDRDRAPRRAFKRDKVSVGKCINAS